MCDQNNTQSIADYLAQLLKDRKQLAALPNVFIHVERLLDEVTKDKPKPTPGINGIVYYQAFTILRMQRNYYMCMPFTSTTIKISVKHLV
ncbi:unnamed protein product [Acanthoscelides obtectus]|uniref:STAR protein homodimerisation region domain-containing protein n=1 Tax=Acanthoscelides obtectus TaxID=200917 RepID=A0A9P0JXW5_ACAOB|nr:unnamed protein product [Acanthoscelides obtectus]CAK1632091.1 Protein held out wings [Acanthoscelides obtectus]